MAFVFILLIVLLVIEAGFLILSFRKLSPAKNSWTITRLIVNFSQLLIYIIMLLLPSIDTSFRFKGLIITLILRIIVSGIFSLVYRKKTNPKKTSAKVFSLIISFILIPSSMIPAFIFSDYAGRPTTGPYKVSHCNAILIDKSRLETFENDGSYREVPVYFFYPAEAKEGEKFPLVVFDHGAFGYYESNASSYLELASNGYVVVSLEHPYHSFFTHDTDGKLITVSPDFMNSVMNTQDVSEEEIYKISRDWMNIRVADMNFALDSIIDATDNGTTDNFWFEDNDSRNSVLTALSHINADKIGLMGHSMGGATSVQVGLERDDIDAVIDIDGTMLGSIIGAEGNKYIIEEVTYDIPLFEIENENAHKEALQAIEEDYPYPNNMIKESATTYYGTWFTGALHMDYTDLTLFSPFLAKMLGSGDVDNEYITDTLNSLEVDFYDCYLKDKGQFSVEDHYQGVK